MGRARSNQHTLHATSFASVFGSRHGRAPGNPGYIDELGTPEHSLRLIELLTGSGSTTTAGENAIQAAVDQLNALAADDDDISTVQLRAALAAELEETTFLHGAHSRIDQIESFCDIPLGSSDELQSIKTVCSRSLHNYLQQVRQDNELLTLDRCCAHAATTFTDVCATTLARKLSDSAVNQRALRSVMGLDRYNELQTDIAPFRVDQTPEDLLASDDWAAALRERSLKAGRGGFADMLELRIRKRLLAWPDAIKPAS